MTTMAQSRDDVLTLLKTAWDADPVASLLPLLYENIPVGQPAADASHAWARATVLHGEGGQIAMGGAQNLHDREGILVVQLFVPLNYSMTLLDGLKELIVSTFEGATGLNGTTFITGSDITSVGQDGQWHQENVSINFEFTKVV